MLSRIRSTQSQDDHATLANELAQARQTYETRKENVLTRATARLTAVEATQRELAEEAVKLNRLVASK